MELVRLILPKLFARSILGISLASPLPTFSFLPAVPLAIKIYKEFKACSP